MGITVALQQPAPRLVERLGVGLLALVPQLLLRPGRPAPGVVLLQQDREAQLRPQVEAVDDGAGHVERLAVPLLAADGGAALPGVGPGSVFNGDSVATLCGDRQRAAGPVLRQELSTTPLGLYGYP